MLRKTWFSSRGCVCGVVAKFFETKQVFPAARATRCYRREENGVSVLEKYDIELSLTNKSKRNNSTNNLAHNKIKYRIEKLIDFD